MVEVEALKSDSQRIQIESLLESKAMAVFVKSCITPGDVIISNCGHESQPLTSAKRPAVHHFTIRLTETLPVSEPLAKHTVSNLRNDHEIHKRNPYSLAANIRSDSAYRK